MSAWRCPKCGAQAGKHGKGACLDRCGNYMGGTCSGLLCECDDLHGGDDHGEVEESPCEEARCYHCGWQGRLPVRKFNPKKLTGWAKQAWAAGWRPPTGWQP